MSSQVLLWETMQKRRYGILSGGAGEGQLFGLKIHIWTLETFLRDYVEVKFARQISYPLQSIGTKLFKNIGIRRAISSGNLEELDIIWQLPNKR